MNQKLTKRDIDSFTYKGGWDVRWDSSIPGFGVRIYPSGKKAYVLTYRHNNRKHLMALGQTAKITLDQARNLALQNLGELAGKTDPLGERRKKAPDRNVDKVFEEFLERYAKPKNRSWKETQRIFKVTVIPALGKKAVHDITRNDILNLIDGIVDRGSGTMANRTLAHICKFFNWCVERGLIENSPASKISKPITEISRDRVLSDEELKAVWHASEETPYPFGPLTQISLLTGQRRAEIATMRWQDIDLERQLWILPREFTKNGRQHQVPLSAPVIAILQNLPKHENGIYVFSFDGQYPFSNFGKAKSQLDVLINQKWQELCNNSDMTAWRLHDLRRTAASGMAGLGTAPHVIERILNHSSGIISGVAAVYNRYDYKNETQEALEKWADKLLEIKARGG